MTPAEPTTQPSRTVAGRSPGHAAPAAARTRGTGDAPRERPEPSVRPARTALVIGGGISGLVAARELSERGLRVTLVEAQDHFGGAVGSHEVAGHVLDSGAESFATRTDAVPRLLEELGLADQRVEPTGRGSWLYLPSGPLPMPSSGVLGIPANPRDPALRPALGRAGQNRAAMDRLLPASVGAGERSLGGLVRARMGRTVLENLVAPVTTGVHTADPMDLDADVVAPGLREGIRTYGSLGASAAVRRAQSPAGAQVGGIRGGMNQLSEALVADLQRRRVRLVDRCDVIAVDRDAEHGQWMAIRRRSGVSGERALMRADVLVLATDPATTLRLLGTHLPAGSLPHLEPGPEIALATLVVRAPGLDSAPRGTGVLVSEDVREVRAKALTHADAKWDWVREDLDEHEHVLRLSYGRDRVDGRPSSELELPDETLIALALHDASRITGVPLTGKSVLGADVVRWTSAMPKAGLGHREKVRAFQETLAGLDRVGAVGAWLAGTGLASVVPHTIETIRGLRLDGPVRTPEEEPGADEATGP